MGLAAEAGRTGIGVFQHKVARKWRRWRGTAPVDDFNAVTGMRRGGEVR
jgi:hypothetical protein